MDRWTDRRATAYSAQKLCHGFYAIIYISLLPWPAHFSSVRLSVCPSVNTITPELLEISSCYGFTFPDLLSVLTVLSVTLILVVFVAADGHLGHVKNVDWLIDWMDGQVRKWLYRGARVVCKRLWCSSLLCGRLHLSRVRPAVFREHVELSYARRPIICLYSGADND